MTSNFLSHKNHKSQQQYKRSLRVESLEERALLSAVPLSASEYADLRAQYSEFNLPQNMADVNVITLDLSQGDNLSSLKSAISTAGTTTKSDLIVVRTTNSKRILTYTAASNELTVNIDATKFGSITIVGLGPQKFTLDADMECRVMTVSGANTIANFGGMIFSYGDSRNASNHDGGGILNYEATITVSNCGLGDNSADFGGAIVNGGNVILNNCEFGDNYAGQDGGAIYNYGDGIITVSNSIFSENEAKYSGGSILNIGTMTITDCTFSDSEAGVEGGAIANTGGTLTIADSKISENTADVGGGIYNSSRITITNCEISNNNAYGAGKFLSKYLGGGGIFAYFNSTTTINNSKILRNQALGRNGEGGGIDTYGMGDDGVKHPVTLIITNSVISNNFSTSDGGGICNGRGSTLTMTQSTVSNNEAYDVNNHGCFGGGVINRERAILTDCTISGNSSDAYGGGIANSQQSDLDEALTITNCTIANNTTWTAGGGIENRRTMKVTNSVIKGNTAKHYDDEEGCYVGAGGGVHGKGTFINCIIAENTAVNGGGFIELSYLSTFVNCTITKNTASNKGGGLHAYQVNVYNSIIVANTAGEGNDVFKYKNSGVFTGANNLSSYTSWSGSGNIVHDGSKVNFVNFAKGDYRLASTSQAINKGSNTYANNAGLTSNSKDLYGTSRFDGTIDIGANEFQNITYSTVVTTLEDNFDPKDTKWSLREAIYYAPINNVSGYPTITFAEGLEGEIDLTKGQLEITSPLVIDGDNRITVDAQQKSRVFYVNAGTEEKPIVFNGLTIQNGIANYGAGIDNNQGIITISNSIISDNTAQYRGGGLHNHQGKITVTNSKFSGNIAESGGGISNYLGGVLIVTNGTTFSGNNATTYGGGILNYGEGTCTVTNSTISGNNAESGGGIYNGTDSSLTLTDSQILNNVATYGGGGILNNENGIVTVTNCSILGNTASGEAGGGGIRNNGGTVTFMDTTISQNTSYTGGGIRSNKGTLTIVNSTISGNTTSRAGGGINLTYTDAVIINSAILNNSANKGGGISNTYSSTVTLTNCTIAGNTATTTAGGIYTSGTVTSNNTIIAANTANGTSDIIHTNDEGSTSIGTVKGSNNLSSYTTWSSGSNNLVYNSSKQLFVDAANADYHLARGSQAIDKGKNSLAVDANGQALTSDLDNLARIMNSTVDMGAYEYRALAAPTLKEAVVKMTTVTFSWNGVPNASGYLFEYKANGDEDWTSETVDGTSFTFEGDLGMEYTARVKALGTGNYTDSVYSSEKNVSGLDIAATVEGKKVTVNWLDESPAADSVRYRVAGTTRWTTKKLKAGVTTLKFNATAGKDYEIQVLRDQSEANILEASAVVLDQAKLKADKASIKDDTFQVSVTNYTAKNLAANAKQAILTINGVKTVVDIANQQGTGALANGGSVAFNNGLFTFTGMNSNTQYKVQVSFSDGLSVSTVSSNLRVKTLKAPYLSPVLKSATAMSSTTIQVEWEPSVGKGTSTPAQYYTVQYSLDGVHWKNATTRATGTSFTIMRLKANTQYLIAVVATKDQKFNASVPSNTKLVRTMA